MAVVRPRYNLTLGLYVWRGTCGSAFARATGYIVPERTNDMSICNFLLHLGSSPSNLIPLSCIKVQEGGETWETHSILQFV